MVRPAPRKQQMKRKPGPMGRPRRGPRGGVGFPKNPRPMKTGYFFHPGLQHQQELTVGKDSDNNSGSRTCGEVALRFADTASLYASGSAEYFLNVTKVLVYLILDGDTVSPTLSASVFRKTITMNNDVQGAAAYVGWQEVGQREDNGTRDDPPRLMFRPPVRGMRVKMPPTVAGTVPFSYDNTVPVIKWNIATTSGSEWTGRLIFQYFGHMTSVKTGSLSFAPVPTLPVKKKQRDRRDLDSDDDTDFSDDENMIAPGMSRLSLRE